MLVYIQMKCSGFTKDGLESLLNPPMVKKGSSFMNLVGFEGPLRGEKKLFLEQENLDSVLKSI